MSLSVPIQTLETDRLLLRQWRRSDLDVFAALNADNDVMACCPQRLNRADSDAMAQQCMRIIKRQGWGLWAVELKSQQRFIGFVGLNKPQSSLPRCQSIEIGWRLAHQYWHQGFATEAAHAALTFAFDSLDQHEVIAYAAVLNKRSQAVMQRLGMQQLGDNFMHPDADEGHPLAEHVLFCLARDHWRALQHMAVSA